jgi:hypothetical protein
MAWSWSHSPEAHQAAYENVHGKDREWLEVCFAEWHASTNTYQRSIEPLRETRDETESDDICVNFDERKYNEALSRAKGLPNDVLAEQIWEWMELEATCDNGGHNAWACPSGCHTVPFSSRETVPREG